MYFSKRDPRRFIHTVPRVRHVNIGGQSLEAQTIKLIGEGGIMQLHVATENRSLVSCQKDVTHQLPTEIYSPYIVSFATIRHTYEPIWYNDVQS